MTPLRVVIADDHPMFRKGLTTLLGSVGSIDIVGQASSGSEAATLATDLQPDLVLMDLQMPGGSGITATRDIVTANPSVRVLVVTLFDDADSVFAALRAGAGGYVLKDADDAELIRAVQAVGRGEAIFSPAIATRVLGFFAGAARATAPQAFPDLTNREREILHLLAQGRTNASIATELALSPKTVSNYVSNIFAKLHVADRAQAVARAKDAGLGQPLAPTTRPCGSQ
ncbi:MAG: response regulator transcription factor [Trueperaceae bacterium]